MRKTNKKINTAKQSLQFTNNKHSGENMQTALGHIHIHTQTKQIPQKHLRKTGTK